MKYVLEEWIFVHKNSFKMHCALISFIPSHVFPDK
uniref:Uncharacterized protein n=1 Tax=Setaria italica TaxID=4555 RepID=K4AN98_SETIT